MLEIRPELAGNIPGFGDPAGPGAQHFLLLSRGFACQHRSSDPISI
jgi:hypothetical protein